MKQISGRVSFIVQWTFIQLLLSYTEACEGSVLAHFNILIIHCSTTITPLKHLNIISSSTATLCVSSQYHLIVDEKKA